MSASDSMLDKVNALIAKANSTEFPAERDAFLAKADALMFQYKIDEITLANRRNGNKPQSLTVPTHEEMEWVMPLDEFIDIHTAVMTYLALLADVRVVRKWNTIDVFGYSTDIRYFRQLWTATYLTFSSKLNPKWERSRTDGENIKLLIESGMKWVPVWLEARKAGALEDVPKPPADNGKMKRLYTAECKRQGVEKMKLTFKVDAYRDSFAIGYRDMIFQRVLDLRAQRLRMERQASDGVTVVLRRQATAVEDLMNATYPGLVYDNGKESKREATNATAMGIGARAATSVDLAGTEGVGGKTGTARAALS
jgi:hypothetical protein